MLDAKSTWQKVSEDFAAYQAEVASIQRTILWAIRPRLAADGRQSDFHVNDGIAHRRYDRGAPTPEASASQEEDEVKWAPI